MDQARLGATDRLARIHALLQGLPGPLGNGEMLVSVNTGDAESVPQDVFTLLEAAAGQLKRWGPGRTAEGMPVSAADLMSRLSQVEEAAAADVLVWLLTTTMAYGGPGRYDEDKAVDVVATLARLLGHSTRWWVNGEPPGAHGVRGWNPVTRFTFDAVIVGTGGGVIVTVLAVDED